MPWQFKTFLCNCIAHSFLNWIRLHSSTNWIRIHSCLNWIRLNPISYWNLVLPLNITFKLLYVELLLHVYVSIFISILKTLVLVLLTIKIAFKDKALLVCVTVIFVCCFSDWFFFGLYSHDLAIQQ